MKRNLDGIVAIFTSIFLVMAFSAYVFVKPVTTIIFIVGGVSFSAVVLYGILLSIAERKDKKYDQPAQTDQFQDQQKAPTKIQVWQETSKVEKIEEGLGLSTVR